MSGQKFWKMLCDNPMCDSSIMADKPGPLGDLRNLDGWRLIEGKDYCPKCKMDVLDKHNTMIRNKYNALKEKGVCPVCKKTKVRSNVYCAECRKKRRVVDDSRKYKFYQRRKESGLCFRCGKIKETEFVNCKKCRMQISDSNRRKKNENRS